MLKSYGRVGRWSDIFDAFKSAVISCLTHDDRLVRQAAIHFLHEANCDDDDVVHELRRIVRDDQPIIQGEAVHALLDLDSSPPDSLVLKCE